MLDVLATSHSQELCDSPGGKRHCPEGKGTPRPPPGCSFQGTRVPHPRARGRAGGSSRPGGRCQLDPGRGKDGGESLDLNLTRVTPSLSGWPSGEEDAGAGRALVSQGAGTLPGQAPRGSGEAAGRAGRSRARCRSPGSRLGAALRAGGQGRAPSTSGVSFLAATWTGRTGSHPACGAGLLVAPFRDPGVSMEPQLQGRPGSGWGPPPRAALRAAVQGRPRTDRDQRAPPASTLHCDPAERASQRSWLC